MSIKRMIYLIEVVALLLLAFVLPVQAGTTSFDMVISAGIPQVGAGALDYMTTGDVYFVDSGHASRGDSADRGTYDKPFATIDYAIGRCTASNGDIIFVAPGHTETVTAASGLDIDVAGIKIIGFGTGDNRAKISFTTAAAATCTIDADDIYIENFIFESAIDQQVRMVHVTNDDVTIKNCEFRNSSAAVQPINMLEIGAADNDSDNLLIDGCVFKLPDAGDGDAAISIEKDMNNITIRNCTIWGDFDEAAIDVPAGGNACKNLQLLNNSITNLLTGQHAVQINSTAVTGVAHGNTFNTDTIGASLDLADLAIGTNSSLDKLSNAILASLRVAGYPIGDVFYVDDATGAAANDGRSWDRAEATIDAAIGDCTADKGDIIFVAPDHEETIADAQIACDVDGIMIIGIGDNEQQPMITFNHANASIDITKACELRNLNFYVTTDSNILIDVDISNVTIRDCRFTASGAGHVIGIDLATTISNITVDNCEVYQTDTDGTSFIASTAGAVTNLKVTNNRIWGDYDNACIYSDQANVNALIKNNIIRNVQSGDHAIEISGATTGVASGNMMYGDTLKAIIDPGSLMCYENYVNDGTDKGAIRFPTVPGDILTYQNDDVAVTGGTVVDIFTINNGHIKVLGIWAFIDTAVSANACNAKLQHDPSAAGPGTVDICGVLDIQSDAQYSYWYITGDEDDALVNDTVAHLIGGTTEDPLVLNAGGIDLNLQNSDPTTGQADFYIVYQVLEPGAYVSE